MASILIADDDELIAEMATGVLIDAGHACGWVTSGEQAWDVIERRRPDLILLDQDMPGISGVSLLRRLRGSAKFYDMSVIMFTAMQGEQDENRAIYAGAQDYIRKPFKPVDLIERVARTLAKNGGGGHVELSQRMARDAGIVEDRRALERRWV